MKYEPELRLLPDLLEANGLAIDIGAHKGNYSVVMSHFCGHSRVVCFEPNPKLYKQLRKLLPDMLVVGQAVSSEDGVTTLSVPIVNGRPLTSRATLESSFREPGQTAVKRYDVKVTTLDSFVIYHGNPAVGFIKIDVEGHELEVLRGALAVINRCRPILLIEAEQRHHAFPLDVVFEMVRAIGYKGFFVDLSERLLQTLSAFEVELHQRPEHHGTRLYVANFIFLPIEKANSMAAALQRRLDTQPWVR